MDDIADAFAYNPDLLLHALPPTEAGFRDRLAQLAHKAINMIAAGTTTAGPTTRLVLLPRQGLPPHCHIGLDKMSGLTFPLNVGLAPGNTIPSISVLGICLVRLRGVVDRGGLLLKREVSV